jgi:hypothetical protein
MTNRTTRGDEGSQILGVEELTGMERWRPGHIRHFLPDSIVRTRSGTNGVGTGLTSSGNPVKRRWSLPVRLKVTLDVLISCWTYGIVRACIRDVSCIYLYLAA